MQLINSLSQRNRTLASLVLQKGGYAPTSHNFASSWIDKLDGVTITVVISRLMNHKKVFLISGVLWNFGLDLRRDLQIYELTCEWRWGGS